MILYENDDYLVLNKPFDVYINSENENEKNTLYQHLLKSNGQNYELNSEKSLHFVHRLDYATSGVICLAKNKMAAAEAGKCFEKRTAQKYYISVLRGHVKCEVMDINLSIGKESFCTDGSNRMCTEDLRPILNDTDKADSSISGMQCMHPRNASTRLMVLERGLYVGQPVSKVLLKPHTGRRHQLRVHSAAVGHTVLGDYTYSGRRDEAPHRMFLHAFRLHLPLKSGTIDIQTCDTFLEDEEFMKNYVCLEVVNRFEDSTFADVYSKIDNFTPNTVIR